MMSLGTYPSQIVKLSLLKSLNVKNSIVSHGYRISTFQMNLNSYNNQIK